MQSHAKWLQLESAFNTIPQVRVFAKMMNENVKTMKS